MAQHEYLLPRLAGQWSHLERLGGGIGTRGPGETQIETDRRLVRNRLAKLKKDLEGVRRHRSLYQSRRRDSGVPVVSLVGYTNAGKSTLLNRMTEGGVLAEDRMFSTLDPVTRRMVPASGPEFLLTDTVGMIQKLAPAIVAAFRATLEELSEAAVLVHVVDITHPNAAEQARTVNQMLEQLGLAEKPQVLALNKADLLVRSRDARFRPRRQRAAGRAGERHPGIGADGPGYRKPCSGSPGEDRSGPGARGGRVLASAFREANFAL